MSESEKENLENTHDDEAENNTSDNPQFEGNYEDKVLEEQYLTPPETEVGRVLSENAELKLALLQTKRANIRIWTLAAVMAAVMGVAMFMWLAVFPKYKWIATKDNRSICEIAAADHAPVAPATLTSYALEAIVNSYTYDYVNYRDSLTRAANTYYSDRGRESYYQGLDESGNLKKVIDGRFILKAYPFSAPVISQQGNVGSSRTWVVQVPVAIDFYTGNLGKPQTTQKFIAEVTLIQTPASRMNLKGLAVDNVVLKPYLGN